MSGIFCGVTQGNLRVITNGVIVEKTGVYVIRNLVNGRVYVGSAARTMRERWNKHRHELRNGVHHSLALQRAWVKHGEAAFEFAILEECAPELCVEREQFYIDSMKAAVKGCGYNMCPRADSPLGRKATPETCAKLSAIMTGRKHSDETRRKMSDNMKSKWADPDARKLMRDSTVAGKTPATYARHSAAMRGRKHSADAKAAIGAASKAMWESKGRDNMVTAMRASGCFDRVSAKLRGRKLSPEVCAKMSASKKGVPKSPEHRQKTSDAIRLWHAKRREAKALAQSQAA